MAALLDTNQTLFTDFVQHNVASCQAITFVSFEKSSGKSTTFRAFLHAAEGITCGITSLGADPATVKEATIGEHLHLVKPGTIIATARQCLPFCEPTRTILAHTSIHTPLGEVIIFRAESVGRVFLAGPSIIADAISIINTFIELGAECVLMDGAGARISPANPHLADGVVLCANLAPDLAQTRENLQYQINLLQIRSIEDVRLREICQQDQSEQFSFALIDQNWATHTPENAETISQMVRTIKQRTQELRAISIFGALTDRQAETLVKLSTTSPTFMENCVVVVEDPTRLLLSMHSLDSIQASPLSLRVLQPIHLLGIAVNPSTAGVDYHHITSFLKTLAIDNHIPVFDVQGGFFFEIPD